MESSFLKTQLATYFLTLAEGEELAENQRQRLCADSGFEPYAAFSRIDRRNHGLVTARDLLDFLQSVDMMGSLCESDCQLLVHYYDTQRDGQSLDYSK